MTHPFSVKSRDVTYQRILHADPVNPRRINRSISRDLQGVIEKALEKDVKLRYQTALEFAEDLRRIREHEPTIARRVGMAVRTGRWIQRNPLAATLILVLTLGFGAFAAFVHQWVEAARRGEILKILSEHQTSIPSEYRAERAARPAMDPASKQITFGMYEYISANKIMEKFDPLLAHCERELGVRINVAVYDSYSIGREALRRGIVDFARFGPVSYVLAKEEDPGITILAIEERDGGALFSGYIAVHEDSDIQSLADLKGKAFAFGNTDSTSGRYLSQALLATHDIFADDLKSYDYHANHEEVAKAVLSRDFDAGAMTESTFKTYESKGLRSIASFPIRTKPVVARSQLDPEIISALKKALLTLKFSDDENILKALSSKSTGFRPGEDAAYEKTREGMRDAKRFLNR